MVVVELVTGPVVVFVMLVFTVMFVFCIVVVDIESVVEEVISVVVLHTCE